jgi:hypothetical protein
MPLKLTFISVSLLQHFYFQKVISNSSLDNFELMEAIFKNLPTALKSGFAFTLLSRKVFVFASQLFA